jgi:hypothetical protein
MTLILTVNGPETIWLLADRRLSSGGRPQRDDARKVMFLETTGGTAILGYAGLGSTALGTEPADWMSAVLRGRNLPLEQSLSVLAQAIQNQVPRHLLSIGRRHHVLVTAFVGDEPRFYTIDLIFAPDRKNYAFRCTRHVQNLPGVAAPSLPQIGIAGTGEPYLLARRNEWARSLLCVVRACNLGRVSPHTVAGYLASLNNKVSSGMSDKSVGPRCIVAWRHRKGGVHNGGGADQFYTGTTRDTSSSGLPIIGCGMDVRALLDFMMPRAIKNFEAMRAGQPALEWDKDEINAELALLPDKPDENLR